MVKRDDIYAMRFASNMLTERKYDELKAVAVLIRDHKNTISKYICEHIEYYLDVTTFAFLKEMRANYSVVPSSFDKQCYEDVLVSYQNKFDAVKRNLEFINIHYIACEVYKRDTKKNKKGDFKKVKSNKEKTDLSTTLTYLARYGNENILDFIHSAYPTATGDKLTMYNKILRCVEKFGFERLYRLALSKRERIFNHYRQHPIEFKSLTFRGRSRKKTDYRLQLQFRFGYRCVRIVE